MNLHQVWQLGMKDMKAVPLPRLRTSPKRHVWILVIAAFIAIAIVWAYLYPPPHSTSPMRDWLPAEPARELTDEERASRVVFRQILTTPPVRSKGLKIAFMFLTPGTLPFERLWEKFFESIDMSYHVTSDSKKVVTENPCLWNGAKRPCYLFARKFYPESINNLLTLFSNYTVI